jgi:hypothetical protein
MRSLLTLAVLGMALLPLGCNSWQTTARAYQEISPETFAIVVPADESRSTAVQTFVEWKRELGFDVTVVPFYTDLPITDQYEAIGRELDRLSAHMTGSGYLLILADDSDLEIVEWEIAESGDLIHSDLPLALPVRPIPGELLHDEEWSPYMSAAPQWFVGRIPLKGSALGRTLLATISTQQRSSERRPSALLGAETVFFPGDAAGVLKKVRNVIEESPWDAKLIADTVGADGSTDELTLTRWCESCQTDHVDDVGFLDRWTQTSPDLVYTIAHASVIGARSTEGEELNLIGTGRSLLVPDAWMRYQAAAKDDPQEYRRSPENPAVFVSTGCSMGEPGNKMLEMLFARKWMVAFIGATEDVGPAPLTPAINAEINGARFLTSGMPLGVMVHVVRQIYDAQSSSDIGLLIPGSRTYWRRNQLAFQVFGDPSLTLGGCK